MTRNGRCGRRWQCSGGWPASMQNWTPICTCASPSPPAKSWPTCWQPPAPVNVVAAAGIGKTRLVEEFLQSLKHGDAPPHILRGRCPAYGEGLTYWPLAEMLKQECDIKDNDPLAIAGQKLHDGVLRVCAPVLGSDESEMLADDLATIVGTEIPRDYDTLLTTRLARLKTLVDGRPVAVRDPSVGSE